jgi:hypothetical protein
MYCVDRKINPGDVSKLLVKKSLEDILSKYFCDLSGLKIVKKEIKISDFSAHVVFKLGQKHFF